MMERFSSLVTKSRPWPVIGRTIFFTSDKNRPTRDEIYFIDFWRENLSMYRIISFLSLFRKMLMSAFLLRFKVNYLEKMRGYPYFSLWIPIALAKIYFFRMVLTWRKKPLYLVGTVLNTLKFLVASSVYSY